MSEEDEQLKRELAKWIKVMVDAHEQTDKLLPNLSANKIVTIPTTKEILLKYASLIKIETQANSKCSEIIEKLLRYR